MIPKELAHARELIDQAKLEEAFEIVENCEKDESLTPKDQLSALLIKGKILLYKQYTRKALGIYEIAYQLSQDLGLVSENIEALIGKANIGATGDFDEAFTFIKEAERRIESLVDESSRKILKRDLLFVKSWSLLFRANTFEAAISAEECLKLTKEENFGNKLDLARIYVISGWINLLLGNQTKALDYAMKSLKHNKELNHSYGLVDDFVLIARIYNIEGDYNQAKNYCKQALSIKELSKRNRLAVLDTLANIYWQKSEINRALKYQLKTIALSEELSLTDRIVDHIFKLGYYYAVLGIVPKAIEYLERSLMLSEKWGFDVMMAHSLGILIMVYMRNQKSVDIANRYFSRLSNFYEQTKDNGDRIIYSIYLFSKATMMKYSTRIRDRMEAQALYKELIDYGRERAPTFEDLFIFSIGSLCELLLEELSMNNDPAILDEIMPLITKSLEMAKKAHNYVWLAETKLLQAKLALIQLNTEEAKKLMIEAQRIADLHGLNLLAWGISSELDRFLGQEGAWDTIIKDKAPLAERIRLASTNGVLERLQGKRVVESPELVEEEPILLLIMDNSGVTYFNHPFMADWDYSDLFSSFMSAFNLFSSEIFSKSIDRIRIGENTILINPVEPFLACYVIKGQSYPALKKLTRFTEAIRENTQIWKALEKSVKTSEMLELNKPPALKTVIDEIFN
ncbi:MAG: tetratricopeptide repeat protein [Candidatus Hermodarchaeota archaeon]